MRQLVFGLMLAMLLTGCNNKKLHEFSISRDDSLSHYIDNTHFIASKGSDGKMFVFKSTPTVFFDISVEDLKIDKGIISIKNDKVCNVSILFNKDQSFQSLVDSIKGSTISKGLETNLVDGEDRTVFMLLSFEDTPAFEMPRNGKPEIVITKIHDNNTPILLSMYHVNKECPYN